MFLAYKLHWTFCSFIFHWILLAQWTSNIILTVWITGSGGPDIIIRVTTTRNSSKAFKCHYTRGPAVFFPKETRGGLGEERWVSFHHRLTLSYLFLVVISRGRTGVTAWCVTQDPHLRSLPSFTRGVQGGVELSFHFTCHLAEGVASGIAKACVSPKTFSCVS